MSEVTDNAIIEQVMKEKLQEKPNQLTREQKRRKEATEREGANQLNAFISRFYEFFMDNDTESEEVAKKRKELSAKWKMFCKRKGFLPIALPLFDTGAQKIIDQFNEQLKDEGKVV